MRGRTEEVTATELDPAERVGFFRDVLRPVARRIPFGVPFIRIVDGVDLDRSGRRRPRADPSSSSTRWHDP